MKNIHIRSIVPALLWLCCAMPAENSMADPAAGDERAGMVQRQFLAGFKKAVPRQAIEALARAENIAVLREIGSIHTYLLGTAPGWGVDDYARHFSQKYAQQVEFAGPNHVFHVNYTPYAWPDDPNYTGTAPNDQWNVNTIQADLAWNTATGGMDSFSRGSNTAIIAVIDSGISPTHEELVPKLVPGWNCIDENTDTTDNLGHGTNVAGIAAAATGNLKGMAGTAPNVMLMPIKITDSGAATEADLIEGIVWAADHGACAANISLSTNGYPAATETACNYAFYDKGMFIASSVGNGGGYFAARYPAAFASVMAVGSSDRSDEKSGFSNYGDFMEVNAPGESIAATDRSSDSAIAYTSATSFSVPIVTGLAAVLMSNSVTSYEAVSRIARTCDKTGATAYGTAKDLGAWNQNMGYGRVNFYRCMKTLVPPGSTTVLDNTMMASLNWPGPALFDTATAGYYIYRSASGGGPFTRLNATPQASRYYDDLAVSPGSCYYYRVTAVDSNGFETKPNSAVSVTVVGFPTRTFTKTPGSAPDTPSSTATPGQTGTSTATPAASPTSTPTLSATAALVPTATVTGAAPLATASSTASPSPAASASATRTATAATTLTATSTFTPATTGTPSATAFSSGPGGALAFIHDGKLTVYPNPSTRGQGPARVGFTLSAAAGRIRMSVYTVGFTLALQKDHAGGFGPGNGSVVLDTADLERLSSGLYYIILTADDGQASARSGIGKFAYY